MCVCWRGLGGERKLECEELGRRFAQDLSMSMDGIGRIRGSWWMELVR